MVLQIGSNRVYMAYKFSLDLQNDICFPTSYILEPLTMLFRFFLSLHIKTSCDRKQCWKRHDHLGHLPPSKVVCILRIYHREYVS